jgi:hypothetical protein
LGLSPVSVHVRMPILNVSGELEPNQKVERPAGEAALFGLDTPTARFATRLFCSMGGRCFQISVVRLNYEY